MKLSSLLLLVPCCFSAVRAQEDGGGAPTCAEWSGAECGWEPNLRPMTVDFDSIKETFYAYVTPSVATFYNKTAGTVMELRSGFMGMYAKFTNLSPQALNLWQKSKSGDLVFTAEIEPFGSSGTSSFPGHTFVASLKRDSSNKPVVEWHVTPKTSLYPYDPFGGSTHAAMTELDSANLALYQMQLQNLVFAEQYKKFTGRDWLALYKQKMPPQFHMWRADAFGQTYQAVTREIQFVEQPDEKEIKRGMSVYGPRPDEVQRMRKFRDTHTTLNLTLTVLSCAPRVFEIRNFLSDVEIEHILTIARDTGLVRSKGGEGSGGREEAWIERHRDFMMDTIYKRVADVLRMNEALLRMRRKTEIPEFLDSDIGVAERLHVVHYNAGEKYMPHHDFAMPSLVRLQPSRFATILFYLNHDMEGGETTFPRWLNAMSSDPLKVKPERGKAILFYNMLPDGNYDERSQHAAAEVLGGEKWMTNLWIWDPVLDHTVAGHY